MNQTSQAVHWVQASTGAQLGYSTVTQTRVLIEQDLLIYTSHKTVLQTLH